MLEKIEEYLDGGLDAAGRREVEALIAKDPAAARAMASAKSQRALRAAAYDTYLPTHHEAGALASQFMARAYAPVGRVGYWVRRGAAVAAAVVVVVGTFAAGRMTSPTPTPVVKTVEVTKTVYSVVYADTTGEQNERFFASVEDRDAFVKDLQDQHGGSVIEVASLTLPGQM